MTFTTSPTTARRAEVPQVAQEVLPALDLPVEEFAAALPGERLLIALIAAGDRFGCWVLRNPADRYWRDGREWHFGSELEATDAREEILGPLEPGEPVPVLTVEQAARPCFTLACAGCGAELGDEDEEIAVVHHASLGALEADARAQRWRPAGRDWTCPTCPPPAWAAVRACRVCGCTEAEACWPTCWWVGADLCSACSPTTAPASRGATASAAGRWLA